MSLARTLADLAVNAANILFKNVSAVLTKGFSHTTYDNGTATAGTLTLAIANGHKQRVVLNGAALAFPTDICDFQLDVTNGASAAAQSFSGVEFDGNDYNTTSGNQFRLYVSVGHLFTHVTCKASSSNV